MTLDRTQTIRRMTIGEVTEEIREEVIWCWRLWTFLCSVFTIEFWITPKTKEK
jgi:hypothetical protein